MKGNTQPGWEEAVEAGLDLTVDTFVSLLAVVASAVEPIVCFGTVVALAVETIGSVGWSVDGSVARNEKNYLLTHFALSCWFFSFIWGYIEKELRKYLILYFFSTAPVMQLVSF